jgi:hypothetical protein
VLTFWGAKQANKPRWSSWAERETGSRRTPRHEQAGGNSDPIPVSPQKARHYSELFQLWQSDRSFDDDVDAFQQWENEVSGLLTKREREFFLRPYGGLDMNVLDHRRMSRFNHLTKILVYRQGIKTTNGFNG